MNATTEDSIHGDPRYVNYKFDPFTFPFLVAFIPLIYLIPTVFVIMFILKVFIRRLLTKKHDLMNPHVFLVIVLSQVTVRTSIIFVLVVFQKLCKELTLTFRISVTR